MAYHEDEEKEADVIGEPVSEEEAADEDEDAAPEVGEVEEEKGWE